MSDLNPDQQRALEAASAWYQEASQGDTFSSNVFRLFGYAGTGKTFTAARIADSLGLSHVAFGTYTGKAASVLRRSLDSYTSPDEELGLPRRLSTVSTIHSAIYFPTSDSEAKRALGEAREELAPLEYLESQFEGKTLEERKALVLAAGWANGVEFSGALDETRERVAELDAASKRMRWEFNPDSSWAQADLIVLDEVSMVNAKLAGDIESYDVPIMVLGDPAQLPPVEGGGYYTDAIPNVMLTSIVRQAEGDPIVSLATRIRESRTASLGLTADDMVPATMDAAMSADVVLVWTNKRRWALVNAMRSRLGRPAGTVVPGDVVMCLTNNKDLAVFNGEIFTVEHVRQGTLGPTMLLRNDAGATREIAAYADGFAGQASQDMAKKSGAGMRGNRMLATFANAITVHKSQGSEWDHVYLVNETPGMISMAARRQGASEAITQARKWAYTAVTRAKREITITTPPR